MSEPDAQKNDTAPVIELNYPISPIDKAWLEAIGKVFAELAAELRPKKGRPPNKPPRVDVNVALELAVARARRRCCQARELLELAMQHVADDPLRVRIQAWLDAEPYERP